MIVTIVSRVGCLGIGLASLELGLQTSFILYIKLYLLLHLHVLKVDLSLQHWTCHFEAGPPAQLHSEYQIGTISGLACWESGFVNPALDSSF